MSNRTNEAESQPLEQDSNTVVRLDPWNGIEIPEGYELSERGVELITKKGSERISGPVWVSAFARDDSNTGWGLLVHWLDRDGHQHHRAIPTHRLHESNPSLIQELDSAGLTIMPGKAKALCQYLASFVPEDRFLSVDRLGWMHSADSGLIYVLPKRVIAAGDAPQVIYQPERFSPSSDTLHSQGSLKDWYGHVALQCKGNPYLTFGLCSGLAASLLHHAQMDGGGFHLYGGSSRGKTTALQVAASVWGSGADPAEAPGRTAIQRWNATRNGLEGIAAVHNDGLLALDELGSCDADDFGRVIYDLAGGQGKAAMDANRSLKARRAWRNLIFSTGEVSAAQKIQESRRAAKAGQLVRLMDIPITGGIVRDPHGQAPDQFVNRLKRSCAEYYGSAGPAFVQKLIEEFPDPAGLTRYLSDCIHTWADKLAPKGTAPENKRAVKRLALALVAGLMAQEYDILPHELDIVGSITAIRDAWFAEATNMPEAVRGLRAIQGFIMANQDRFREAMPASTSSTVRDLCGYTKNNPDLYLFTTDGFNEACQGYDPKTLKQALMRGGWLHINENRPDCKHDIHINGSKIRTRFIAVKAKILEAEFEPTANEDGAHGAVGQA